MEAAAAIMSHYDKLCCSVTQNGNILKVLSTCKKENDCRMQHYYPTVQHRAGVVSLFMTHDWHSPYLRREQDTPGRGSRTARSSWLVSPLTAPQCHCVWSLVLGWQLLYCNCGLTTALLPASGHRSASTQSPHRTSGTRPQPRHTRGLLSLLLVSGKRLELSRGPDVPGCQGWMVQGELSPR